jgi:hypothetical protein
MIIFIFGLVLCIFLGLIGFIVYLTGDFTNSLNLGYSSLAFFIVFILGFIRFYTI